MSSIVDVSELRPGTDIYLPGGVVTTVLRATTDNDDGTATVHTDNGDLRVALPCVARLA